MEWAVCTASCDSEDEVDQEASADSTNHSQASIDLAFVSKASSVNNGLASRDSVEAEAEKKPPHKDVRDLTHFGKKDGHEVAVPHGMCPPLTVNASVKDGVSYSASKHHTIATMNDEEEEEELFAQEVLEEPAEEHHSSTPEPRVSQKQNPGRAEVQGRKRRKRRKGREGPAFKLVKKSEPPQKNQMSCGEGSSDPTRCQQSGSVPARHLEENNAAKQSINCTQSKESFSPPHEVHTGKVTYDCYKCKTTFQDFLSLSQHRITAHQAGKLHKCPECKKSFMSVDGVSEHRRAIHKVENPFKCSECSAMFSSVVYINKHRLETQHEVEIFKCPECDRIFLDHHGLHDHQMAIHNSEKKAFECSKCKLNFPDLSHLVKHNFLIHRKTFKCSGCNMSFTSEYIAKKHWILNHTAAKPLKSTESTKTVTSSELVGQQEIRTGMSTSHCTKCNITFKNAYRLERHQVKSHMVDAKFISSVYGQTFAVDEELVGQQEILTGKPNKTFKCPEGTKTVTSSELVGQQEILTGKPNKTFMCTEGTTTVTSSSELVGQQEIGTGKPNKTFKCTEGTKTVASSELLGHQEIRTGKPNKTFKCTEGTKTVTSSELVGQQEIRTGKPNKTLKRTEATKTVTSSELVGQQETRTGKSTSHCTTCNITFKNAHRLKRHQVKTHMVDAKLISSVYGQTFAVDEELDFPWEERK